MNYSKNCVEYIIETEFEDFMGYIEGDAPLVEEERLELIDVVLGKKAVSDESIKTLKKLVNFHIFASAFLSMTEEQ